MKALTPCSHPSVLFATAAATEGGGSSASALAGSTVTGVGIADVAVFLTANPNPSQVNTPLTYSILAFNIGDDDAQGVVVKPGAATECEVRLSDEGMLPFCDIGQLQGWPYGRQWKQDF